MKETGIIGGGASGMMAALTAAGQGASVTILEKQSRPGKKILATGNGKCNLSNRDLDAGRDYHSRNPERLPGFFEQYCVDDTVSFFNERGLVIVKKNGSGLYPRSGQASSVLDVLRRELERLQVRLICDCNIREIHKKNDRFLVQTDQGSFSFDRLILACGSSAGTRPGDMLGGYGLARSLGITVLKPLPALVQLRCRDAALKSLAGVRCDASVCLSVTDKGGEIRQYTEQGELQLTDYGISGIPVFQLSRHASLSLDAGKKVHAIIDFVPEYTKQDWKRFCRRQLEACWGRQTAQLADGVVHKKIAQVLLSRCGLKALEPVMPDNVLRIRALFELMRAFPLEITAVNPPENAQVCAGGIPLTEVDDSLQARKLPGLFFCGEMLDVDGRCGGYNLQWAWTSGHIAGMAAAKLQ